jgi:D-tyrosyl-tRNA(Tyr) deacylase
MRVLIQRVTQADVKIDGEVINAIGPGMVVLFGVGKGDTDADVEFLARKTANLRIFSDDNGKLNLSVLDIDGEVLVVSQFTLYADCTRGNRPGFEPAAAPDFADNMYEKYLAALRNLGVRVASGVFQADMLVNIANDGPVTIMLESR